MSETQPSGGFRTLLDWHAKSGTSAVLIMGSTGEVSMLTPEERREIVERTAAMKNGRVPIVLGGDHSLSIGSVSGVLQYCAEAGRTLFVLWLDAHADFNTPATSPSAPWSGKWTTCCPASPGATPGPRSARTCC